jgi:hypothetical protein
MDAAVDAVTDAEQRARDDGRPGRPLLFEPLAFKRLLVALAAGNHVEPACRLAGVTHKRLQHWQEKGAADLDAELDTPYAAIVRAIHYATADDEARKVAAIGRVAENPEHKDNWRAAALHLSKRYRSRWADDKAPAHATQIAVVIGIAPPGTPHALEQPPTLQLTTSQPSDDSDPPYA